MRKKLFCIFLIAVLLISLVPSFVLAEGENDTENSAPTDAEELTEQEPSNTEPSPEPTQEPEQPSPEPTQEPEQPSPEPTQEPEQPSPEPTQEPEQPSPEPTQEPEQKEEDPKFTEITIFYTGGIKGSIANNYGSNSGLSYSKAATLKNNTPNSLLLDAGDHLSGTVYADKDEADTILKLMNLAHYDAAVFGGGDFARGFSRGMNALEKSEYVYLNCSIVVASVAEMKGYEIFEMADGVRVAVIGVSGPVMDTEAMSIEDLAKLVQNAIDRAKAEGADYIIALGYLGGEEADWPYTAEDVIHHTTGLHAFIDGRSSHKLESASVADLYGNTVILTRVAENFQSLGRMIIHGDGTITAGVYDAQMYSGITPEAGIKALEDSWIASLQEPGETEEPDEGEDPDKSELPGDSDPETGSGEEESPEDTAGTEEDEKPTEGTDPSETDPPEDGGEILEPAPENAIAVSLLSLRAADENGIRRTESEETGLGDFTADAFYWYTKKNTDKACDIVFLAGGSLTGELPEGYWTEEDLAGLVPSEEKLSYTVLSGQQVLDALEWGARAASESSGASQNPSFLQVAGLKYKVALDVESTVRQEDGNWSGSPSENYRVYDVQVYNDAAQTYQALEKDSSYHVIGLQSLMAEKGFGYSMFHAEVINHPAQKALLSYVKAFSGEGPARLSAESEEAPQVPVIRSVNSPLTEKSGYSLNYEAGSGRIAIQCSHVSTRIQNQKEATCTEEGYTGDVLCNSCQTTVTGGKPVEKLPHSYAADGVFHWNEDNTACTVDIVCLKGGETLHMDCAVTERTVRAPTTTMEGTKNVTAKVYVGEKLYSQSKTVILPAKTVSGAGAGISNGLTGTAHTHVYTGDPGLFSWNTDYSSCVLTAICDECAAGTKVDCVITSKVTHAATTVAAGSKTVTAKAMVGDKMYSQSKTVVIPAKNSNSLTPVISGYGGSYTSSSGGSSGVPTGDTSDPALFAALAGLSLCGVIALGIIFRRKRT